MSKKSKKPASDAATAPVQKSVADMTPEEKDAYVAKANLADRSKKTKPERKAPAPVPPQKSVAEMTPDEKDAYIASLEANNERLGGKLRAAKIDEVDTSFEAEVEVNGKKQKHKFDFTTKMVHIFGEVVDIRALVQQDTNESNEKLDKICAELVKINSGIIKRVDKKSAKEA